MHYTQAALIYTSAYYNHLKHQQLLPDICFKSMCEGNLNVGPFEIIERKVLKSDRTRK